MWDVGETFESTTWASLRVERFIDIQRRLPLSPALSPEYVGDGGCCLGVFVS
jgi:hypothetical protein